MATAPRVRADLEYFDQVIEGDELVLVRDPVRGTYFRFNVLQAAMLRALDGHRTPAEITAVLSEQFEVEIPPASAERFIARARTQMLLEISAYQDTSPAALVQVDKALRKAGFHVRVPGTAGAAGATRPETAETRHMIEAFAELELGHPRAAAAHLAQILAENPEHARARQLYDLIQTAYIRAAGGTTDFPTWVIFNPSRLLTWLSRTIGRVLFSWVGAVAMFAFFCVGVYAYTNVDFGAVAFGPREIALAIALKTVSGLLHEVGHGICCQHYGGNVTEIGFTLFYYVQPAFYCDTSSSYLIAPRRHKMVVQLGGTIMSQMFNSALAIVLALMRPSVPVYPGLALVLVIASGLVFVNLNPFLKFDGYYAICDFVGFPNLKDRSSKIARAWLGNRLFGLELPTEDLPRRTRVILVIYAVISFAFTAWFIYFGFSRVLVPIVERYRGAGLVFSIVVAGYMLRNLTLRPLWQLARMIVRERRRIFTRRRVAVLAGLAIVVIAPWFLTWPVLVDADFVVVPAQRADVRAQVAGRVADILVVEGEHVRRGQPIATLRDPALQARIAMLDADAVAAAARVTQLRHGARGEEKLLAHRRLDRATSEVERSTREADVARSLVAADLGTQAGADRADGALATSLGAAGAARWWAQLLDAGTRREDIAVAEADAARIAGELAHLRADAALLTLRSPIDGVIATAHLEDRRGLQLAPGDLLAEVHDLAAVVGEIALSPSDPLAEVGAGREVELRLRGAPDERIHARIARVRDAVQGVAGASAHGDDKLVLVTAPFTLAHPISGLTGHARIYGAVHSLAYANLYLPLQRLVRVRLWSMW